MDSEVFEAFFNSDFRNSHSVSYLASVVEEYSCFDLRDRQNQLTVSDLKAMRSLPVCLILNGAEVQFGSIPGNHSFIKVIGGEQEWGAWVKLAMGFPQFLYARRGDRDFDYWSNVADVSVLADGGFDVSALKLVSNGLPPPLAKMVVDIRDNPGRRVIKDGYAEAVGSTMWLTDSFFDLIGFDGGIDRLLAAGWDVDSFDTNCVKISVSKDVFSRVGDRGVQQRLRSALYG